MSEGTTPKFAENAKYADWFKEYNFGNCKLNREKYTRFLANYITSEQDGFVLNLNGSWGTGKTHFLKRLYTHLLRDKRHPTIYIDAWESDFIQNPLAVISSELLNQLSRFSQISGKDFQIVKDRLGTLLRSSMIGLAAVASKSLVGDSTAGAEFAKEMMSKTPSNFLDDIQKDTTAQVAAIPEIRKSLSAIAEVIKTNTNGKAELPVVVLIDELDRCRPNYAIELLEVVKHFFTTEKFVFVIASDTEQLKESIKTIYGNDFNSTIYLRRFFNRQAALEQPETLSFMKASFPELTPKAMHQSIGLTEKANIYDRFHAICNHYSLSLRDIEQVINKYLACTRQLSNSAIFSPVVLFTMISKDQIEKDNSSATRDPDYPQKYINETLKNRHSFKKRILDAYDKSAWRNDQKDIFDWIDIIDQAKSNIQAAYIVPNEEYEKLIKLSGTLTGMDSQ
ncbi:KAP family P-loop NTPase fold protein [Oceanospirillum sanctuarii]|uniref:KAP family P-loop NTPase fold protein n=1 Tax=Oceanospirillum sanctuarii TaxID=1434821 RepID=UPI000A363697|nr:P-loop NTPase fold protein [Oceanospirillum sanctuarii]